MIEQNNRGETIEKDAKETVSKILAWVKQT